MLRQEGQESKTVFRWMEMPFSEFGKTGKEQVSHNEGSLENSVLDMLCFECLLYVREEISGWICVGYVDHFQGKYCFGVINI